MTLAGLLPDGVLNVVLGGAAAGEALVVHPDVPRLSFTGSLRTGLAVQAAAGSSGVLKSLTLELGRAAGEHGEQERESRRCHPALASVYNNLQG